MNNLPQLYMVPKSQLFMKQQLEYTDESNYVHIDLPQYLINNTYTDYKILIQELKNFAISKGFKVSCSTGQKAKYNHVNCSRAGKARSSKSSGTRNRESAKCGCEFDICIKTMIVNKQTFYAVVPKSSILVHNHELDKKKVLIHNQDIKRFMHREITEKKYEPIALKEIIEKKFDLELNYSNFCNTFYKEKNKIFGKKLDDAQNMLDFLQRLKTDDLIDYNYTVDKNNKLNSLTFATNSMREKYKVYGDLVIIDGTFGTNVYKMSLVVYCGIHGNGPTIIFGFSLLTTESSEDYQQEFKNFLALHDNKYPLTLITDSEKALGKAIKVVFPDSFHALCTWHIQQNIKKHFMFLKRQKNKENLYENLMKWPYMTSRDEYDNFLRDIMNSDGISDALKEYLKELDSRKQTWSPAHIGEHVTLGIHTTSRVEGINSLIKRKINGKLLLFELLFRLLSIENQMNQKSLIKYRKHSTPLINQPLLLNLQEYLTQYAFEMCLNNWVASWKNTLEKKGPSLWTVKDEIGCHWVKFEKNKYICECYYTKWYNLPCHHIFSVKMHEFDNNIDNIILGTRWNKDILPDKALDDIIKKLKDYIDNYLFSKSLSNGNNDESEYALTQYSKMESLHDNMIDMNEDGDQSGEEHDMDHESNMLYYNLSVFEMLEEAEKNKPKITPTVQPIIQPPIQPPVKIENPTEIKSKARTVIEPRRKSITEWIALSAKSKYKPDRSIQHQDLKKFKF